MIKSETRFVLAILATLSFSLPPASTAQQRIDPNQIDPSNAPASVAAANADFLFRVPVELRRMRTDVKVLCAVGAGAYWYWRAASAPIPLDNDGNYVGTISVGVVADEGSSDKNATNAEKYACSLLARFPNGAWGRPGPGGGPIETRPQPDTEFKMLTQGPIPW